MNQGEETSDQDALLPCVGCFCPLSQCLLSNQQWTGRAPVELAGPVFS